MSGMNNWDHARVKSHIRFTAQRLAHLQEKLDAGTLLLQADVASLLAKQELTLARAKAEILFLEDVKSDVLGKVEMYCDMLLGFFSELNQQEVPAPSSPAFEPICCILYATMHIPIRELHALRDMLVLRFSTAFYEQFVDNTDSWVPLSFRRRLQLRHVPLQELDAFMIKIAQSHSVPYEPLLAPKQVSQVLGQLVEPSSTDSLVDVDRLRQLCKLGIPHEPRQLRPRVWRILCELVSGEKEDWMTQLASKRNSYYDMADKVLSNISLEDPKAPLSREDVILIDSFRTLTGLPLNLVETIPFPKFRNQLSPLSLHAEGGLRITKFDILERRCKLIKGINPEALPGNSSTTVNDDVNSNLQIVVSGPETSADDIVLATGSTLSPEVFSLLLRLVYLHRITHANSNPHLAIFALVLYSCLALETRMADLAHAEADAFWMLNYIIGELAELSEDSETQSCLVHLGHKLERADDELYCDLKRKRLDPELPHYSYRWLSPLFCYTFPIKVTFNIWDSIFSRPNRNAERSQKVDFAVDICVSMLLVAKQELLRLGLQSKESDGLFAEAPYNTTSESPSRRTVVDIDKAFIEGVSFLQNYPLDRLGGAPKIITRALSLSDEERFPLHVSINGQTSAGLLSKLAASATSARTGNTSFEDDGQETETPRKAKTHVSLSDRLKLTVRRGISNESAMEGSPSPSPPASPMIHATGETRVQDDTLRGDEGDHGGPRNLSLWDYTEGIRDSDAVANLSKLGSNWKAKMLSSWSTEYSNSPQSPPQTSVRRGLSPPIPEARMIYDQNNSSSLQDNAQNPERPPVFRSPRESFAPQSRRPLIFHGADSANQSADEDTWSDNQGSKVSSTLRSLAALSTPNARKNAPKKLLLDASNLITSGSQPLMTRSATTTPTPHQGQWTDVYRDLSRTPQRPRDSLSSISTHSTSLSQPNSIQSAEGSADSRIVPLRRASRTDPSFRGRGSGRYALASRHSRRMNHGSPRESSGSEYLSDVVLSRTRSGDAISRGWQEASDPASPDYMASYSPLPRAQPRGPHTTSRDKFNTRSETTITPIASRHSGSLAEADRERFKEISLDTPPRTARLRAKRHSTRPAPAQLQLQDGRGALISPGRRPSESETITPRANAFETEQVLSPPSAVSSAAEEGDDEDSYDDILGGYGSDHARSPTVTQPPEQFYAI